MGLISRVSSRTYRNIKKEKEILTFFFKKCHQRFKNLKRQKPKLPCHQAKVKRRSGPKVRDKLQNAALFDKTTWDKFKKEVPGYKVITPSIVSERMKVRASLAKFGLRQLHEEGLIEAVTVHAAQSIYTKKGE